MESTRKTGSITMNYSGKLHREDFVNMTPTIQKNDDAQEMPDDRIRILFGSPKPNEGVEEFLVRMGGQMDEAGIWNPDETLNLETVRMLGRQS